MPELQAAVLAAIEARRHEAYGLLADLVRLNSVNPSHPAADRDAVIGGETAVNEVLEPRYRQAGLRTHWVGDDARRMNLVGVRPGAGGGPSLALNGHVDTVAPVEPGGWSVTDPWTPEVRDGRLVGLGATDMKAGGVAMWLAAQALEDAGATLDGDLQLHSVVGEESMEHELGTTGVLRAGFATDAAIVTEPTSAPDPLTIQTVSPGYWSVRISVRGKATHCGNRARAVRPGGGGDAVGVNALEKLVAIVGWLQELEVQWGHTKSHPWFPPGAFVLMPGVMHADAGLPVFAPIYFPDRGFVDYTIWHHPDESSEAVHEEIAGFLRDHCRTDPWLREHPPELEWDVSWPPFRGDWDAAIVQSLAAVHQEVNGAVVAPPSPHAPKAFMAVGDATWYERAGIPCAYFGPGDGVVAHCVDESVALAEVDAAARALAVCALRFCGTTGELET